MKLILKGFLKSAELAQVATVGVMCGDKLLLGRRRDNGRWTNPGGHMDPGESPIDGAQRELREESGIEVEKGELKHVATKKVTTPKGKQIIVHAFTCKVPEGTGTSMKNDPDKEVHRWQFVDVSKGIPEHIANNLHSPKNVLFQGMGLQETGSEKAAASRGASVMRFSDFIAGELPTPFNEAVKNYDSLNSALQERRKRRRMEKQAWWNSEAVKIAAEKPKAEKIEPDVAEEAVDPSMMDPSAGRLTKLDSQGGAAGRTPEEMQKAQASDLVTLPVNVQGANCGNCRFVKVLSPEQGRGFCTNPAMMMDVTDRMCCSLWDAPGVLRDWAMGDAADAAPPGMVDQMVAEDPGLVDAQAPSPADDMMDPKAVDPNAPDQGAGAPPAAAGGALDPNGAASGMPAASGQPAEEEAAADVAAVKSSKSKPKSEKSPSKSEKKDGNTINIHVGHGAEKKAMFWGGFQSAATSADSEAEA